MFNRTRKIKLPNLMYRTHDPVVLFEENGGGGGGGGNNNYVQRDPVVTAAKYANDTTAMARHIDDLERERYQQREKAREDKARIETLEKAAPAEGTVVLTAEQAKDWEAYTKLGKAKDLETLKTENDTLKQAKASSDRDVKLREIADTVAPGVKFDFQVFKDLDSQFSGLEYEVRDVEENGQKIKKAFVKFKDGEGDSASQKEAAVLDFYKDKRPKYLPALMASGNSDNFDNSNSGTLGIQSGVLYPEQIPSGNNQPKANGSVADSYIASRYGHNIPAANTAKS